MDGIAKPEPTLSGACCAGPDPYRPFGKFQVAGRISGTARPIDKRSPLVGNPIPSAVYGSTALWAREPV